MCLNVLESGLINSWGGDVNFVGTKLNNIKRLKNFLKFVKTEMGADNKQQRLLANGPAIRAINPTFNFC